MALTDEIFKKHLSATKKTTKRQYSHFRPFDDPDHLNTQDLISSNLENKESLNVSNYVDSNTKSNFSPQQKKLINNQTQSQHEWSTKGAQNRHQPDTKGSKTSHNTSTNETQYVHELLSKTNTNIDSNQTQIANKLLIHTVVGNQRKLLFYIYDLCRIAGTKSTPPLNIESIHLNTGVAKGSIKTSLIRLIQKKFLIREEIKNGRSGWVIFKIPDPVYQELFNNDVSLSLTQTRHKLNTESRTKTDTSVPIVSSSYINTTTTIPEEFKQIDCSPLKEIGFDESHIIQIYREYLQKQELSLSVDIIQNSIHALAFDLKHNNVGSSFKISPAVVLTSMLKKGQPYSSKTPEQFLTPQAEAMKEYIFAQEQKHAKILEIESKTKNFVLQEWLDSLGEQELLSFSEDSNPRPQGMPEKVYQTSKRKKSLMHAKEYFDTIIWPTRLREILNK